MIATSSRPVLRTCFALCVGLAAWLAARPAAASVHLWRIRELYSSDDGVIQYLELFSDDPGETLTNGESFRISSLGLTGQTFHSFFTFDRDLTLPTLNRSLLIATPGYAALGCAPQADFLFSTNRVFDPRAIRITVHLPFAEPVDTVVFEGIPTNGTNSANRAGAVITFAASSPTNQADVSGTLAGCDDGSFCNGSGVCANGGGCGPVIVDPCPAECDEATNACVQCLVAADCPDDNNVCTDATCLPSGLCGGEYNGAGCDDGLFCTMTDVCSLVSGTCSGSGSPCGGGTPMCDETNNMCAACLVDADCNDSEVCTDDDCTGGTCSNPDNTAPCDDGLFCTATDLCNAGTCGGSDACTSVALPECDEATNQCVECLGAGDCDDTLFCNGTESCASGACQAGSAPCSGVCVEASDTCADCTTDGECDDSDPCSVDDCDGNGDCIRTAADDGTPCEDDGRFCTGVETCNAGTCVSSGDPCVPLSTANILGPAARECNEGTDRCNRCGSEPAVNGECPEDADSGAADAGADAGADAAVDAGTMPDGGNPGTDGGPRAGRSGSGAGSAGRAGSSSSRDGGDTDASDDSGGGSSGCDCRVAGAERTRGASPAALWLLLAAALLVASRRWRWREVRRRVRPRARSSS